MNSRHEDIFSLWQRFTAKQATPEELETLFALFQQPGHQDTFRSLLADYFQEDFPEDAFNADYWQGRIKEITSDTPIKPLQHLQRYWQRYAAAAVLLAALMLAVFWGIYPNRPDRREIAATSPAENTASAERLYGAILTLAGGRQIVLDSLRNGVIAQEGDITVSVRDGQLVYEGAIDGRESTVVPEHIISTPRGRDYRVRLPDGTQVWLNAASSIRYPVAFSGPQREVALKGEGYFDVTKDKSHPFIINTANMDIKVVGTVFNVRAYETDKIAEATLIEGAIEVSLKHDPGKKILLKPHEKISIENYQGSAAPQADNPIGHAPYAVNKVNPPSDGSGFKEVQWLDNKLVFDKQRLDEIAVELSRWYDVEIVITEDKLKSQEFTGTVGDASLEQVMESLKLIGDFKYSIQNKQVIISQN